ncbi:phage major capsid protein [Hyphomonas sp.]|uniref:phage major capsid protein n=1 Tax=Hyphomonas sp. TaxID=87 RepID=UPI001D2FF7D9|nr:phage major capsid protein [Hyphomonas sp.]MBU4061140.1 phage major capsid protein [Alphaproteobacteria bacterium]MBU4162864.1 phage major capsid protein [Alphaproteobacteria bacterium]
MFNNETLAELTKVGVSASDVKPDVLAASWAELHERRKKLRKAADNVKSDSDAAGAAFNAMCEAINLISDEIDTREARGERESPHHDRMAMRQSREDAIQAARTRMEETRVDPRALARSQRGTSGFSSHRDGEPLVLRPGDSAADVYGRSRDNLGDVVKAALTGDHSRLSPQSSQLLNSGGAGGFLVPDALWGGVVDLARAKMRIAQAGATIIDAPQGGTMSFPTLERDPVAHWRGELADINLSSAAFGLRTFKPYTVAVRVEGSIELLEDSPTLGDFLMTTIGTQIAEQVDYAALAGNGIGQPLGILNHADIQQVDAVGVLADYDPFARAVQKVRQQNVEPGVFILSPSTLGHIDRLADTTGQPLQPPPSLRDRMMLDTNQVDVTDASPFTASAVTGEWASLYAVFRQRLVLEISRTSGDSFKKLGWQARGYARVDSFAVRPNRFCKVVNLPAT